MNSIERKLYLAAFGGGPLSSKDKLQINSENVRKHLKFDEVISNLSHATPLSLTWFRLLGVGYTYVYGREEDKSRKEWNGMTDMAGNPAFVYKELDGKYYNLDGLGNPGFPGS